MLWFYRSVKIILFIIFNKSNLIFFLSFSAGVIASVSNKSDIFTEFENTVKQLKETLTNAENATKGKDIASQTKNYLDDKISNIKSNKIEKNDLVNILNLFRCLFFTILENYIRLLWHLLFSRVLIKQTKR